VFDVSSGQATEILGLAEKGDVTGLLRVIDIARAKRPRDSFALASGACLTALSRGEAASPEALAGVLVDCMTAARLVPEGAFYDTYRSDLIGLAGLFANGAALAELGKRGWVAAPASRGAQAVRVWRTYLALDSQDSTGEGREPGSSVRLPGADRGPGRVVDRLGDLLPRWHRPGQQVALPAHQRDPGCYRNLDGGRPWTRRLSAERIALPAGIVFT
jgi:hypothetical protein